MILRCFAATVTRNRKGLPIRLGKVVAGDPITVGRSADSTIFLPDPRVQLRHAIIRNNDLGKLYVEGDEGAIDVNGELQNRAKLRRGDRILIGPYQVTPEPATGDDHDFGLSVELVQPLPETDNELRDRSATTLGATWLPKRSFAWALLGLVGCLSLAIPLAYAISPKFKEQSQTLPSPLNGVAWNAAWDPGPLSPGHQSLKGRCDACHQIPFQPIQDGACVTCHASTGDHVRAVSSHAGVTLGTRCAECHLDHKGERTMVRTDPQGCVDCHADIRSRHPKSDLPPISDFSSDHPTLVFSIVNARTGRSERSVVDPSRTRAEASGLKFPHETHVAKSGIRGPLGVRVLQCSQCHKPDEANERFKPPTMSENCSECHRLDFEPEAPGRQAPHGEPDQVLTSLREFYSTIAIGERSIDVTLENGLLRRPALETGRSQRKNAREWAEQKAFSVAEELIEKRVCVQCHAVTTGGKGSWTIEPVKLTSRWLPGIRFDHVSHKQAPCEECHDARASKQSSDIIMPALPSCRSCHVGASAVAGKVRSPCAMCHSFHQPNHTVAQTSASLAGPNP